VDTLATIRTAIRSVPNKQDKIAEPGWSPRQLRRTMALSRDSGVTANRILMALPANVFERVRSEMELVELGFDQRDQPPLYKVEMANRILYFIDDFLVR
jgi:hypothetical protein